MQITPGPAMRKTTWNLARLTVAFIRTCISLYLKFKNGTPFLPISSHSCNEAESILFTASSCISYFNTVLKASYSPHRRAILNSTLTCLPEPLGWHITKQPPSLPNAEKQQATAFWSRWASQGGARYPELRDDSGRNSVWSKVRPYLSGAEKWASSTNRQVCVFVCLSKDTLCWIAWVVA